ncbi:MAG: FAD:protein FMN transferase [Clostridiales Family XIII bacterium]|nr:FAD:protein FMN transferase [Clostridiales Family XIII bacterium]
MKKVTRKIKKTAVVCALLAALAALGSCGDPGGGRREPIRKTEFLLDTICTVTVFSRGDEKHATEALALCAGYEKLLSSAVPDSEISKINGAGGAPVTVSDGTAALLERAVYYGTLSDGAFDVTIGRVSSLWDFSSDSDTHPVPEAADIEAALPSADYRNIELAGNVVRLKDPAARLDLGGIAKGFIADRMAEYLTESGVRAALIDLGGNIVTVGGKESGAPWTIGVRNPAPQTADGRSEVIVGTIEVEGTMSVGTSGTYERFFMRDGLRYHHILDPKTGFPVRTDLAGVTVVTEKSVDGDGIATICVLYGSERARDFLRRNNIPAVLVKEDGAVIAVGGVKYTPAGGKG